MEELKIKIKIEAHSLVHLELYKIKVLLHQVLKISTKMIKFQSENNGQNQKVKWKVKLNQSN